MESFLCKQHLLKQDFQIIEAINVWYVFPRELIFQFYLAWREDMLEKSKENSKDGLKSLLSQNFEAFFWAIHAFVLIVSFFDDNKLGKASRQFENQMIVTEVTFIQEKTWTIISSENRNKMFVSANSYWASIVLWSAKTCFSLVMKCFDYGCLLQVQIKTLVKFRRVQSVEENSRSFQFNYDDCEASQINVWFGWESVNIVNLYLENWHSGLNADTSKAVCSS